jgi:hypothetical protein
MTGRDENDPAIHQALVSIASLEPGLAPASGEPETANR